jgi:hypothetical protein
MCHSVAISVHAAVSQCTQRFDRHRNIRICRSAGRCALSHAHPGFDFAGSVLLAGCRKGIFEAFVEFTVQFLVGPHRLLWIHSVLVGRCGVKLISHMMSSFRETNAVRRGWVPEPEEQMQSANVVVGLREPYASSIKIKLPTRCERICPVARSAGMVVAARLRSRRIAGSDDAPLLSLPRTWTPTRSCDRRTRQVSCQRDARRRLRGEAFDAIALDAGDLRWLDRGHPAS